MPLLRKTIFPNGTKLGLWRMTESPEDLFVSYPHLEQYRVYLQENYHKDGRRLEFLCSRILLFELAGIWLEITHRDNGAPLVEGYELSISHTRGFAAVILSKDHPVAVDIEYPSDRVGKIASRFLRSDEHFTDIPRQLIAWCAKETCYKYFSTDHLDYPDMCVQPFTLSDRTLMVDNLKRSTSLSLDFEVNQEFTIVWKK